MVRTRKVQVTLDEAQYGLLEAVASREGRKLAAVVRESIVRYCVEPAQQALRIEAVDALEALEAPVPASYEDWEREYAGRKTPGG